MNLDELIEKSYSLFEKYVIGKTLHVCKVCCVTAEEESRLINTPLRTVSSELLEAAYYRSARNYSDRELWEMKHFLPRVLELANNFDFPCHSTEIVFARLDLDKPEKWAKEEMQLLTEFSVLYFRKCLTFYPFSPESERVGTYLVMFGVANFNLKPLMNEWENTDSIEGLLHFKDFVLNDIEYNAQSPYRLTNAFSNPAIDGEVINWLANKATRRVFSVKIEKQIIENRRLDEETLAELSWTYELLQQ